MQDSNISTDKLDLSNNVNQNLTQFLGQDGSEFVINTTTGDAFISQRAAARVLETSEATVRRCKEDGLFTVEIAVINTPAGKRSASLISATDFYKLADKYKPELAKQMLKAGANLYIYGLAGYKISISEPEPISKPSQAALNIEWAKAYILNQQMDINLENYPGTKKLVNFLQSEINGTIETEPPVSVVGWLIENDIMSLLTQTQIYALNRRAATLYRTIHLKSPKRLKCEITGKRSLHYDVNDFVIMDMAFDTLEIK